MYNLLLSIINVIYINVNSFQHVSPYYCFYIFLNNCFGIMIVCMLSDVTSGSTVSVFDTTAATTIDHVDTTSTSVVEFSTDMPTTLDGNETASEWPSTVTQSTVTQSTATTSVVASTEPENITSAGNITNKLAYLFVLFLY